LLLECSFVCAITPVPGFINSAVYEVVMNQIREGTSKALKEPHTAGDYAKKGE
jgi:hypothetical protein